MRLCDFSPKVVKCAAALRVGHLLPRREADSILSVAGFKTMAENLRRYSSKVLTRRT